jgi:hypothetical protein
MKLILKYSALMLLVAGLGTACNKELESHGPISNNPAVPLKVSNVRVENGNGVATISYALPKDTNLLYVKAVYTITSGQECESRSSYYNNSIQVEGFADTLEHEVKLYSVSRSEVVSEPVVAKIKPLVSPLWQVYRSLQVINAFGGYNLMALNPSRSNISILVTSPNVFKEYETDRDKSIYTKTDSILSKVRGLDTISYRYGFVVKDRWGNKTDTLYKTFKPIYEAQLDPAKFSTFVLPGDAKQVTNGAALQYAWDGRLGWPGTSFTDAATNGTGPQTITFNLGALAKLSRIWIRPFPEGTRYYYLSTMKRFEIWGSANPNLNGAYDQSWILLGSYTLTKPSGLPYGTDSAEDQATAAAGFNWEIDLTAPKVQYIRIRCLENFAGGTNQSINELKVYGDPR